MRLWSDVSDAVADCDVAAPSDCDDVDESVSESVMSSRFEALPSAHSESYDDFVAAGTRPVRHRAPASG